MLSTLVATVRKMWREDRGSIDDKIVIVVVGLLMVAVLVPIAISQIVSADISTWTGDFAVLGTLWPLIGIVGLVGVVTLIYKTMRSNSD